VSRTSHRADGDIVRDFLSVADLLAEPQLAQLYAYLARQDAATVQDVMDDLELAQGTAYSYVNRLVDAGVVDVTDDEQPRRYAAREIDLTVTTAAGDREYTITPALIDAVGRRETTPTSTPTSTATASPASRPRSPTRSLANAVR